MKDIKYETDRLIVREWEKEDYKDLFELASDSEITKFLHYKTYENIEEAKNRIENIRESYKSSPLINNFAVVCKTDNKVIGDVNISSYKPQAGGSGYHSRKTNNKKH